MYSYEIWMDGCMLTESDSMFDSGQEAMENGIEDARSYIYSWQVGGVWKGETVEDFDIKIKEGL